MANKCIRLFLLLGCVASFPACAASFVTWQEEVKLNDGRIITVTQKKRCESAYTGQNFAKCIAREAWLTFKLPEFSDKEIVWHENLGPLVLNIDNGKLYVIGSPPTCREFSTYGKQFYIGFLFEEGGWSRLPIKEIPERIYETNMLTAGYPPEGTTFLPLARKESRELNGDPRVVKSMKRVDPAYKSNC